MDIRRGSVIVTFKVDAGSAQWPSLLRAIEWDLGQRLREYPGVEGVSCALGEVVYEGKTCWIDDAPEADNAMGDQK